MTVTIDSVEPNIFPAVEHLDARDAGRNVEVIFEVRIEGKSTPVTVKLGYEQSGCFGRSFGAVPKDVGSGHANRAMRWSLTYKRAGTVSTSSLAFACGARCRARSSKTVADRNAQADRPEARG
jgi:hypothetical protein